MIVIIVALLTVNCARPEEVELDLLIANRRRVAPEILWVDGGLYQRGSSSGTFCCSATLLRRAGPCNITETTTEAGTKRANRSF